MSNSSEQNATENKWGAFELCWYTFVVLFAALLFHRLSGNDWFGTYPWMGALAVVYLVSIPVALDADQPLGKLVRIVPSSITILWFCVQFADGESLLLSLQHNIEFKHFFFVFLLSFVATMFTPNGINEVSGKGSLNDADQKNSHSAVPVARPRLSADPFSRIVGQEQVIAPLKEIANIARGGIKVGKRNAPHAVLLFIGPTGVGKTEAARALTESVYGTSEAMIRFDMGQFTDAHQANRFYGPPPGYVGSDHGGQLTQAVLRKPHSLVLLDEVEKAHPQIWDAFLPVFDEGYVVDGSFNKKVDMTNTIIVLTSNLLAGIEGIVDKSPYEIKEAVEATKAFRPELLGRINEILVFRPLTPEVIAKILRNRVDAALWGLSEQGISITVDETEIAMLADKVQQAKFGVRQIDDVVRTHLRARIAEQKGHTELAELTD